MKRTIKISLTITTMRFQNQILYNPSKRKKYLFSLKLKRIR